MKIELNIETPKDLKELRAKAPELTDIALGMIDECPFNMPRLVTMETTVSSPIDFEWESVPVLDAINYREDGRINKLIISFVDEEAFKNGLIGDPVYSVDLEGVGEFSDDDFDPFGTEPLDDIPSTEDFEDNSAKFVRNDKDEIERVEIPMRYYERCIAARNFCDVLLQYLCRNDDDKTLLHSNLLNFFTQGLRYITDIGCQNSKAFQAISDAWTELNKVEINDIPAEEVIDGQEVLNNAHWKIPNSDIYGLEE